MAHSGVAIERAANMTYWEHDGSLRRFQKIMETLGIDAALREAGVQEGDTVVDRRFRIGMAGIRHDPIQTTHVDLYSYRHWRPDRRLFRPAHLACIQGISRASPSRLLRR